MVWGRTKVGEIGSARAQQFGGSLGAALGEQRRAQDMFGAQQTQQQEEQRRQLEARQGQSALAQALSQQAAGQGPSVAQAQLQGALQQNMAQARSMAAGARGNTALAQRNAMNAASQANLQAGAQAAALRAQEQFSAQSQLGQLLGQQRSMDIGQMQFAGQQGMTLEQMRQQQLYAQMQGAQQADIANLGARTQQVMTQAQLDEAARIRDAQFWQGLIGGGVSAGGSILAAGVTSDRRAKKKIKDANHEVGALLKALRAQSYDYKSQEHGKGRQFGLMAQDLERSRMGKSMVELRPDGLRQVNVGKAAMGALAAAAELSRRIDKLEGKGA